MTATAVCSVSDEPPSLLLCVNRNARLHDILAANGVFCVNILAAGQEAISQAFSDRTLSMDEAFRPGR
jgi:flavin reductase